MISIFTLLQPQKQFLFHKTRIIVYKRYIYLAFKENICTNDVCFVRNKFVVPPNALFFFLMYIPPTPHRTEAAKLINLSYLRMLKKLRFSYFEPCLAGSCWNLKVKKEAEEERNSSFDQFIRLTKRYIVLLRRRGYL